MIRRKVAIKNHMNFHTNVSSCWIQLAFIVHLLCSYTKHFRYVISFQCFWKPY